MTTSTEKRIKFVFEASDADGNKYEHVIEKALTAGKSEEKGTENGVHAVVNALYQEAARELDMAGMNIPEALRPRVLIELTLGLLNNAQEIRLPAALNPVQGPELPAKTPDPPKPEPNESVKP